MSLSLASSVDLSPAKPCFMQLSPSLFSNMCQPPPLSIHVVQLHPFQFHAVKLSLPVWSSSSPSCSMQFNPSPPSSIILSPFIQSPCSPALIVGNWLISIQVFLPRLVSINCHTSHMQLSGLFILLYFLAPVYVVEVTFTPPGVIDTHVTYGTGSPTAGDVIVDTILHSLRRGSAPRFRLKG